ncbi:MAG TPA: PilZ domain-containing protein [Thermoanaerobaculia bacterium]
MRPLTAAVTPNELGSILELPPTVIDALIESGRVLCQVKNGEPRIPLDQIETLFRDGLMKLYRAEVEGVSATNVVAEVAPPAAEAEPEPIAAVEPEPPSARPQLTIVPRNVKPEPPEQRMAPRYVPLRQIGGIFGETKFTIVQMSATGLRIRHREALMPGDEAKLSFALMRPARSFVVRAKVVWTRLAKSGDEHVSISGLRIVEHGERLARAIELLESAHELQRERRARPRRDADALVLLSSISDDEIALVTTAMEKFANDPVEATRWYSRARFALADEEVRRTAPPNPRDREEVLGIWEYLERQIDLAKVAGVVNWARGA